MSGVEWWHNGPATDRLTELRHRRMLIGVLIDDVASAARGLASDAPEESWRSAAERAYRGRHAELGAVLAATVRGLGEALAAVNDQIAAVKAQVPG